MIDKYANSSLLSAADYGFSTILPPNFCAFYQYFYFQTRLF